MAFFTLYHLTNWLYLQKPQLSNLGETRCWLILVNNSLCSIPLYTRLYKITPGDRCGGSLRDPGTQHWTHLISSPDAWHDIATRPLEQLADLVCTADYWLGAEWLSSVLTAWLSWSHDALLKYTTGLTTATEASCLPYTSRHDFVFTSVCPGS